MIGAEAANNHCSFLEIGQTRILTLKEGNIPILPRWLTSGWRADDHDLTQE
jgi:hypothetical protein